MKKLFTLMLAVGIVSIASAQHKQIVVRKEIKTVQVQSGRDRNQAAYNQYSFSSQQKQTEINRINRQYDQKIAIIQRSRSARTSAMGRKVRQLEQERNEAIRSVEAKYDHEWNNSGSRVIVKSNRSDKW